MVLQAEAAVLGCLAVVLAGPLPAALSRAFWPRRDPRAALVAWQAVGLGGGLAILGAGLTLAAGSVDDHWLPGITALPSKLAHLGALGWAGVTLTLIAGGWLVATAATSAARVVFSRRTHRHRLDAIAETVGVGVGLNRGGSVAVHLVDHPHAVAYCLPGLRPRVVVSLGAVRALGGAEFAAVVAHERAHARGRHDLVIQPFVAWRETFPFLRTASRSVAAVELLVEMLADDAARRTCRAEDLQQALRELSREHRERTGQADPRLDGQLAARITRLEMPPRPLSAAARISVYVLAAALVVVPPAILLAS